MSSLARVCVTDFVVGQGLRHKLTGRDLFLRNPGQSMGHFRGKRVVTHQLQSQGISQQMVYPLIRLRAAEHTFPMLRAQYPLGMETKGGLKIVQKTPCFFALMAKPERWPFAPDQLNSLLSAIGPAR
jgi:hypothetical protein